VSLAAHDHNKAVSQMAESTWYTPVSQQAVFPLVKSPYDDHREAISIMATSLHRRTAATLVVSWQMGTSARHGMKNLNADLFSARLNPNCNCSVIATPGLLEWFLLDASRGRRAPAQ
jgi:hypothetical protein